MKRILPIFLFIGIVCCGALGGPKTKEDSGEHSSKKEGNPGTDVKTENRKQFKHQGGIVAGSGFNPGYSGNEGTEGGNGFNPGYSGGGEAGAGNGFNPGYSGNDGTEGGSGFNPGDSGSGGAGSGFNPGYSGNGGTEGGSGFNPGESGNGGGSGFNPGYSNGEGELGTGQDNEGSGFNPGQSSPADMNPHIPDFVPNPSVTNPPGSGISSGRPGGSGYRTGSSSQSSRRKNNFKTQIVFADENQTTKIQYENKIERNNNKNLKPAPAFLRLIPLRQTKPFNPRQTKPFNPRQTKPFNPVFQSAISGFSPVQTLPFPIQFAHESQISDTRYSESPILEQLPNSGIFFVRQEQPYNPQQSKKPYTRPVPNYFFGQTGLSFGNQNPGYPLYYSLRPFLQTEPAGFEAANTLPSQIVFNDEQDTFGNVNNPYVPNGSKQPYLKPVVFNYLRLLPFKQPQQVALDEYTFSNFNPQKQTKPYNEIPSIETLPSPIAFSEDVSALQSPPSSIHNPQLIVMSQGPGDNPTDLFVQGQYGGQRDEETNYAPRGSNIEFEDSQNVVEAKTLGGNMGEQVQSRETSESGFNPGRVDTRPSFPPGFNAGRNLLRGVVLDEEMMDPAPELSWNFGESAPKTFIYVA